MFRCCRCVLQSLPFVPMALSTLDTLEQRLESANLTSPASTKKSLKPAKRASAFAVGGSKMADQLQWFSPQSPSPFFISPKHDGVRLISYVPPTTSSPSPPPSLTSKEKKGKGTTESGSGAKQAEKRVMTCYSRYGRPIYGLFWIEEELQLLRALCGDPALIIDGELYLHQSCMGVARSHTSTTSPVTEGTDLTLASTSARTKKAPLSAHPPSNGSADVDEVGCVEQAEKTKGTAGTFTTGFLAVSALVHRLRGPSLSSATERDILQYVPALPKLCVFDIPSYSPCSNPLAPLSATDPSTWPHRTAIEFNGSVSQKKQRQVLSELQRVRQATMDQLGIRDVEQLRVVPNITPFSQRLRTMHFLFQLLEQAMTSTVLRAHFCPSQVASIASKAKTKSGQAAASTVPSAETHAGSSLFRYHGGRFVRRIPYQLATSIEETRQRILPAYLQNSYEGAVIRTPINTYDFKEKRKGTLAALVAPLLEADPAAAAAASAPAENRKSAKRSRRDGFTCVLRTERDRAALLLALGGSGSAEATGSASTRATKLLVRAYPRGTPSVEPLLPVDPAGATLGDDGHAASDAIALGEQAVRRASHLPTRSETAVKVLAYQDREYAILRPLLKEPSKNPNTRVLVAIPRASVSALGYPIKPDTDTAAEGDGKINETTQVATKAEKKSKTSNKADKAAKAVGDTNTPSPMVVFYGLQCLAENGLVFNVSMPKLTLTQQKALLDHLLAAGKSTTSAAGRLKSKQTAAQRDKAAAKSRKPRMASLTGLYATVKFSTLTEHGLPRFGTVKAIRGGKGWFM